ncbi:MAG TPA: nucleotide exchange factor GrpE [bacterium]|nr:nucleotide exchange factor GrpE [bacterium]HQG44291.1 nucleotide exchange factor GrpE [bacterium]HQI47681.1 nucleotide exchange factor GrpE [bacterium]HQJ63354.1 nucleotide exchange factor GrpE [bacterium]
MKHEREEEGENPVAEQQELEPPEMVEGKNGGGETVADVAAMDEDTAVISALTAENKALNDRYLRLAAEFDNYRKRSDREMQHYISNANFELMARLLPALDDLDRIVAAAQSGTDPAALVEGILLLQKNILKTFQESGLEPMPTLGEEFDPQLHDALLHIEVPNTAANRIVEEHKKGYFFKGKVLRHAQVVVSK